LIGTSTVPISAERSPQIGGRRPRTMIAYRLVQRRPSGGRRSRPSWSSSGFVLLPNGDASALDASTDTLAAPT